MAKTSKKSVFGDTENELKKHIERNKSNIIDLTAADDKVREELDELNKTINLSQDDQDISFDIPSSEEINDLIQNSNFLEDDIFDIDDDEEEIIEVQKSNPISIPQGATVKVYSNVTSEKSEIDTQNYKKSLVELEDFKTEVQRLMSVHGYSFLKAKEMYESSQKPVNIVNSNSTVQIIKTRGI